MAGATQIPAASTRQEKAPLAGVFFCLGEVAGIKEPAQRVALTLKA